MKPSAGDARARRDLAQQPLDLGEREPVRLRHEDRELARLEGVAVERDVDRVGALERGSTANSPVRMPAAAMNSTSGGSRLRAPTSATCSGSTAPASIAIRSGIPHALPDGDVSGVFRSPCASIQTTARHSSPAESDSIAPTWEQQQPPSTTGRSGSSEASSSVCSASESASMTPVSGYGSAQPRRRRHRLAAGAPRPRHADEAGAELAPAGVALVLRPERDGRERAAVRAAGAEPAHRAFS